MVNDMTSDYRGEERDKSEFRDWCVTWALGEIFPYITHTTRTTESSDYKQPVTIPDGNSQ